MLVTVSRFPTRCGSQIQTLPRSLINNAATPYGLQNVQGLTTRSTSPATTSICGRSTAGHKNRHDADIFPEGLDSPLLDLLNVRYIVVPAVARPNEGVLQKLREDLPTAYRDDQVRVLENRAALPRAWIVHSARREGPERALKLLSSGKVDPRRTALLEQPPPNLVRPTEPSASRASVTAYESRQDPVEGCHRWSGTAHAERGVLPGLEGIRRRPSRTALPVLTTCSGQYQSPAGEHTVELRYESWSLTDGDGDLAGSLHDARRAGRPCWNSTSAQGSSVNYVTGVRKPWS